jgi:hypothetical protein
LNLSHHDKIQNVNNRNLCKNCLRPNHSTADCRSKFKCKYCHQNHNSLLHQQDVVLNSIEQGTCNLATPRVNELKKGNGPHKVVLLSTALIYVKNNKNKLHECRALLDVGSQTSIITESLAKKLNLNLSNNNIFRRPLCNMAHFTQFSLSENLKLQTISTRRNVKFEKSDWPTAVCFYFAHRPMINDVYLSAPRHNYFVRS